MIKRITALLFAVTLMTGCTEIEENVLEENTSVAEEEVVEQVEENNEDTLENEKEMVADSADINNDLIEAVDENDIQKVQGLLKDGADPNFKDEYGLIPLSISYFSEESNNFTYNEVIKVLLEEGANPNLAVNDNNDTALSFAVLRENVELIKVLLAYGADPLIKNNEGLSAISELDRSTEIGRLFYGADETNPITLNLENSFFKTFVLDYFLSKGFSEVSSSAFLALDSPTGFVMGVYGNDLANVTAVEAAFELVGLPTNGYNISYIQHIFVGVSNNDLEFKEEVNTWFVDNLKKYGDIPENEIYEELIIDDLSIELSIQNNIVRIFILPL